MIENERSGGSRCIRLRGMGETALETCAGVDGSWTEMGETALETYAGVDGSPRVIAGTVAKTCAAVRVDEVVLRGDSVMSTVYSVGECQMK